ncbi:MAG: hypothetical protein ACLQPD_09870 [Desulfomonilaceae bacterium]
MKILFDLCRAVTYHQEQENKGFFMNMTTVFSLWGLVGGDTGTVLGPRSPFLINQRYPGSPKPSKEGKPAA